VNNQEKRILRLDAMLRDHEHLVANVVCSRLGVDERTIRRDLMQLRKLGAPLRYERSRRMWYYEPGRPLPHLQKLPGFLATTTDRFALLLSLAAIEEFRGTSIHARLQGMYQRMLEALPPENATRYSKVIKKIRFAGPPVPPIKPDIWTMLINALEEPETLRMEYITGRTGKCKQREIDPYLVIVRHRDWFIVAHDHESGEVRTFLLRRIVSLEGTEKPFKVARGFSADAYLATSFDGDQSTGPIHHVKLRFLPEAAQYGREFVSNATQAITEQPDGSVIVEFDTGALYAVQREVLGWGGLVQVIAPAELQQLVTVATSRRLRSRED